jgi:hypothetical protein
MIFVPVANYLSQRLKNSCHICQTKFIETPYKICHECMSKQTKRVENWGIK